MTEAAQRIWALSDLHVDYDENWDWLRNISSEDFRQDALIVAGDISDRLDKVTATFELLQSKFAHLCFVPGNHDLWVRSEDGVNSLEKLHQLLDVCQEMEVSVKPVRIDDGSSAVWVVPLFSWYATRDDGEDSLFVPKHGRDLTMAVWSDRNFIKWPDEADSIVDSLFALNEAWLDEGFDAPVISFSHFLPDEKLIFPTVNGFKDIPIEAQKRSIINFSRVAGSRRLARQIGQIGSTIHIYGHHHRNRQRRLGEVDYISYTLGYPQERADSWVKVEHFLPTLIWDGASVEEVNAP